MKAILKISISVLFLSVHFASAGQATFHNKDNSSLFPLKIGYYWVYSNSNHPEQIDTIKITKKQIVGSDTGYFYNDRLWVVKNDSVYKYQASMGGASFPSLQYFTSEKPIEYGFRDSGCTLNFRTVTKLKDPYKVNGKEFFNCYEFSNRIEGGYSSTIISKGIGIIETKSPQNVRSLIEFKIN